jgi:hypothetical protein
MKTQFVVLLFVKMNLKNVKIQIYLTKATVHLVAFLFIARFYVISVWEKLQQQQLQLQLQLQQPQHADCIV